MATYFQSLTATGSVSDTNHIATISGTYTSNDGTATPTQPFNFSIQEVNPTTGQVIAVDPNIISTTVSNGQFAVSYNASTFPIPAGYKVEVATSDTANGSTISTQPLTADTTIDGYLSGAQTFVDTNGDGVLDNGEFSATTDGSGVAFLPSGSGTLVATGGTDTTTGLAFTGTLMAPTSASVITPITTLVNQVAQLNGGNVSGAETAIASALGLASSLDLDSLDPIASTTAGVSGAAGALAASVELVDTAKLISSAGASGNFYSALAAQILQGGSVDLTSAATITSLAAASGLSTSVATAIGQIASASNLAAVQAASSGNPSAIISAMAAIGKVAQDSTAAAVAAAVGSSSQLAQVVAANTGSALSAEIAAAGSSGSSGVVTGAPTNSVSSQDLQILQGFVGSLGSDAQVSYLGTAGAPFTSVNLNTDIGVVTPGANLAIHATVNADLLVSGGSTVDLSGSPKLNTSGQHLSLNVAIGDGNNTVTLNRGPSSAHSSTGNDTIFSSGGHDSLYGGLGHDSLVGGGHSQLFGGSGGGDTLVGGNSAGSHDTLFAGSSPELLETFEGKNEIFGLGQDTINAGQAQDTIVAGAGHETITAGVGSTIFGGGATLMTQGYENTYYATGADTIFGSNASNTVNINDGSDGVLVNGKMGTGALTVNMNTHANQQGSDTLFGGMSADGTTSNLTVVMNQSYSVDPNLDSNGLQVVHTGNQTLHVNNVIIEFNGNKTLV